MKFELNSHAILMLQAMCSVCHVSGYRAQDLCITASKTGDAAPGQYNGKLRFEITSMQSFGEFETEAVVHEEGKVVTNSYFLSQLPDVGNNSWLAHILGNKLHVVAAGFVYDFDIGVPEMFRYEPQYCETHIDLSAFSEKIGTYAAVIKGFVDNSSASLGAATGAVKITGQDNEITFEATNLRDAIFGTIPLDKTIDRAWSIMMPIAQFDSWKNLPINAFPLTIGVDAQHQLTARCGPLTIQHNTLTNLIDSMEDVAGLAQSFTQYSQEGQSLEDLKFAMRYQPNELNQLVQNSVLYVDGDPTITVDGKTPDGGLNIIVRSTTVDSDIAMDPSKIKIERVGGLSVNKSSLALVNKIVSLSSTGIDPENKDTYMVMRVLEGAVMTASPDGRWVAITAETSI